jgi:hypothetical protein
MQLPKAAWIEKQVINRRVNVGEAEHEHHLALLINEEHHERRLKQPHHEEEDAHPPTRRMEIFKLCDQIFILLRERGQ